jgi:hypothetical protein
MPVQMIRKTGKNCQDYQAQSHELTYLSMVEDFKALSDLNVEGKCLLCCAIGQK